MFSKIVEYIKQNKSYKIINIFAAIYKIVISQYKLFSNTNIIKFFHHLYIATLIKLSLARTPEIGQGLGRILSCGARKSEQT